MRHLYPVRLGRGRLDGSAKDGCKHGPQDWSGRLPFTFKLYSMKRDNQMWDGWRLYLYTPWYAWNWDLLIDKRPVLPEDNYRLEQRVRDLEDALGQCAGLFEKRGDSTAYNFCMLRLQ